MILFNSRMLPAVAALSNMWIEPFYWQAHEDALRVKLFSVEAGYQAAKAICQDDFERIARVQDPFLARRMGRRVQIRPDWNAVKVAVMATLVDQKFDQCPIARDFLLKTGNHRLEHLSPWDLFWGVDGEGHGQNMLGNLLMDKRRELTH